MDSMYMSWYLAGFACGAAAFWQVSKAVERFRRARRDWRAAKAGMRTLIEMMFRRGWDAFRWAAFGALLVVLVVYGWWKGQT